MSFFVKSKHNNNGRVKFSKEKNRKRKQSHLSQKDEDITSSEDEGIASNNSRIFESEDENETAQEKKLRLAKIYLEEIGQEEKERLEDQYINKDIINQRLKDDYLKQTGKYKFTIADKYTGYDNEHIRILKCREQRNTITCICVSSDDKWLFAGSKDDLLCERKKGKIIPFIKSNTDKIMGHSSGILCLAISTDKKFLVVGDHSAHIQIWNADNLEHVNTLKGHRGAVTGLCFKNNSHTLYSSSMDRSVRVWSLDEMSFVENLFGHQDTITSIDVMNGDRPVTSGGRDGTIRLWKIAEESQLIYNANPSHVDIVKMINEQNFISGADDGQLAVWSALKKKPLASVSTAHGCDPTNSQPYWISSVAAFCNSDLIASGSQDGFVRLWKLRDGYKGIDLLFEIPVVGFVNCLSFTGDGKYLIVGSGKDHKFGRWTTVKAAVNCIRVIPLKRVE